MISSADFGNSCSYQPPVLISRFMLNLWQIDTGQSIGQSSNFSAPRFRVVNADSIFDNFGEPLDYGASLRAEDDDGFEGAAQIEGVYRADESETRENQGLASTDSVGGVIEVCGTEGSNIPEGMWQQLA